MFNRLLVDIMCFSIADYISDTDYESFYYFSIDLMSEEEFSRHNFSLSFRKSWFTYDEYKERWNYVNPRLFYYSVINSLCEDILLNDLMTLDDFKDAESYDTRIDSLIRERVSKDDYDTFYSVHDLNHINLSYSNKLRYIIFDYRICRNYKFDAQEDKDKVRSTIDYNYKSMYESLLGVHFYDRDKFKRFLILVEEERDRIKKIETNPKTVAQVVSNTSSILETELEEIKLPRLSGEYVEVFNNYGKLHISAHSASIKFYFPGPDLRYNGTFIYIEEENINKYITAYQNNWQRGSVLYKKTKELLQAELREQGEMGMMIVATRQGFKVCLDNYHLPISSQKECEEMIRKLKLAKLRIKEIRSKLF